MTDLQTLTTSNGVELARFTNAYFNANAWLVMNATHAILIDTASNGNADGAALADAVRRTGRTLQAVVLSHGHPDIFLGMKALLEAFPGVPVMVARPEIIEDIISMAGTMRDYGMLSSEDLAPERFDYAAHIQLMPEGGLVLQGSPSVTMVPWVTPMPTEFTRLTCLWMAEIETLFVSDLAYNHVHAWAGMGVDRDALKAWPELLRGVIAAHHTPGLRVLTGHGPASDGNVLHAQRAYLLDLLGLLDDGLRGEDLEAAMSTRYPGHAGGGFQLHMTSTNPAF